MNPPPSQKSPLTALLLYLVLILIGGALLAPWAYWLVQSMAAGNEFFQRLAAEPFSRYVHRCLLLLALIGLKPLLHQLGADSWEAIGLVRPRAHARQMAGGFALGFVSLALVAVIALAGGGRDWGAGLQAAPVAIKLAGVLISAGVVAVLEEILFRGGIYGGLRRAMPWPWALGWSSAIYAIVHFFARTSLTGEITWLSGMQQLGLMLSGFLDWRALIPGFVNLTLAGVLLGLAYQRTGRLWFSIGLHAGWIFWLNAYGRISGERPGVNTWFWGTNKLIDGWLATVALTLALVVMVRIFRRSANQTSTPTSG